MLVCVLVGVFVSWVMYDLVCVFAYLFFHLCLFACLIVCWIVCVLVCMSVFVWLFVCLCCSFGCLCVFVFVRLRVQMLFSYVGCLFVRVLCRSFVCVFACLA